MNDTNTTTQRLLEVNALRGPLIASIVQSLDLPKSSHGLDAGCGIGLPALSLVESVGADGRITGLDIDPGLLVYAEELVKQAGLSGRIRFQEGDVNRLPFAADNFNWAWSADCIGYPAWEGMSALQELVRVVKPGGNMYILAWSSQQVLPGYALLEARLNASCSSYIPYLKDKLPEQYFLRAPHWLRAAGLEEIQARTFVGEVQAPLGGNQRTGLLSLIEMLWQPPRVASKDWEKLQRLTNPGSADFILDQPDYYAFFTYTLFTGKLP
jgi:ubiquinone/menaquinone biosynthesis C-methylase UbiE